MPLRETIGDDASSPPMRTDMSRRSFLRVAALTMAGKMSVKSALGATPDPVDTDLSRQPSKAERVHTMSHEGKSINSAVLAGDGSMATCAGTTINLWPAGDSIIVPIECDDLVLRLEQSTDGRYVAAKLRNGHIRIFDTEQRCACIYHTADHANVGSCNAWGMSGNGATLVVEGKTNGLTFVDVATGEERVMPSKNKLLWKFAVSPDGSRVVTSGFSDLMAWDTKKAEAMWLQAEAGRWRTTGIAICPDGCTVASCSTLRGRDRERAPQQLCLWNINDGSLLSRSDLPPAHVPHMTFHADGHHLAIATEKWQENERGEFSVPHTFLGGSVSEIDVDSGRTTMRESVWEPIVDLRYQDASAGVSTGRTLHYVTNQVPTNEVSLWRKRLP